MTAAAKTLFHTILDTEGHQMAIKYCMEGFIKYLNINTVGNSKRGFIDHDTSGRSLILRSRMITCSCITGYDYINVHLTSLI